MTLVVAASTIFDYGALYSDVQVTFRDGTTRDVLQKSYPVARFVSCGFAGSVKIGFMLIKSLSDHLALSDELNDTYAYDPLAAILSWSFIAPSVFASVENSEKALGSRLLLVVASPVENPEFGAKIYFVRFTSPTFKLQIMSSIIKFCSIGSGASVLEYKHSIKPLFRLSSGLLRAEIGRPGGWGNALGHAISRTLGEYPRTGISRHLNAILVAQQGFRCGVTNQIIHNQDGSKTEHKMPAIATDYVQFLEMANASGYEGAGAVC
jgi:hypothetical protein